MFHIVLPFVVLTCPHHLNSLFLTTAIILSTVLHMSGVFSILSKSLPPFPPSPWFHLPALHEPLHFSLYYLLTALLIGLHINNIYFSFFIFSYWVRLLFLFFMHASPWFLLPYRFEYQLFPFQTLKITSKSGFIPLIRSMSSPCNDIPNPHFRTEIFVSTLFTYTFSRYATSLKSFLLSLLSVNEYNHQSSPR